MGNMSGAMTEEQNEAISAQALRIFHELGVDVEKGITSEEWDKCFEVLDADGDGCISRKEWFTKHGTTDMYDAFPKRAAPSITRVEWNDGYASLDANQDGKISTSEWLRRRKVRVAFHPLGMGVHSWGVGVGGEFYEVLSLSRSSTEMAVVGPNGIMALGAFAQPEGAREQWLLAVQDLISKGSRPQLTWLREEREPRSRPEGIWQSFEVAGWTMRTDAMIEAWIQNWVQEHPTYCAMDAIGRECNEQTFSLAFISWLIGSNYTRITDNTKGRVLVYGGLTLLAGIGIAVAVNAKNKSKQAAVEDKTDKERRHKRRDEEQAKEGADTARGSSS